MSEAESLVCVGIGMPLGSHLTPFVARLPLGTLPDAEVDIHMTVVIPPATAMEPNPDKRLAAMQLSSSGNA